MKVESILGDGDLRAGVELRRKLRAAGYAVVPTEAKGYWQIPNWKAMTPLQFYAEVIEIAQRDYTLEQMEA